MIREKKSRGDSVLPPGMLYLAHTTVKEGTSFMLLKNQKEDTTDYTKDWPARYYDIPTGALRREHLKRAKAEGFAVPADSYREMLCERRFFPKKKTALWMVFSAPGP